MVYHRFPAHISNLLGYLGVYQIVKQAHHDVHGIWIRIVDSRWINESFIVHCSLSYNSPII